MCRRTITHYMHHDARAAMVFSSVSSLLVAYANPLRTNFHQCELVLPPLDHALNGTVEKCAYHTCCWPKTDVEYCAEFMAHQGGSRFEPEQCDAFILEHRHERYPYFGNEGAYREKVPATWRDLAHIRAWSPGTFPGFAHERRFFPNWAHKCFAECEKLYILEQINAISHASMQDMMKFRDFCAMEQLQGSEKKFMVAQSNLRAQNQLVSDMFQWGTVNCGKCHHPELHSEAAIR
ncbi:hypothetical protein GGR55DRAFT_703650 [Xylaria sp. FL0064]|nr:hypothetical protein GGR55DRAFT_703650 [Xylaria sp. FL0064]